MKRVKRLKSFLILKQDLRRLLREIYSVSAYGDYIMKQSFPQTATGEFLDRHAELRSITRKTASYAKGAITVYRTESSIGSTVSIPKGTIFQCRTSHLFSLQQTEHTAFHPSHFRFLFQLLPLRQVLNITSNRKTAFTAVNPPAYLNRQSAVLIFSGGWDMESDEALRERILSSYKSRKNAVSAEAVEKHCLL